MPTTYAGRYGDDNFSDRFGRPLPVGTSFSVYVAGTNTLAALYTNRDRGGSAPNPSAIKANGNAGFFADPDDYDIEIDGAPRVRVSVLPDSDEPVVAEAIAAADVSFDDTNTGLASQGTIVGDNMQDIIDLIVNGFSTTIGSVIGNLDALSNTVAGHVSSISTLQTDLITLEQDVADLNTGLSGDIAAVSAALATHDADTTNVHGIANTASLIVEGDARLTNSRTPTGTAGGVLSGTYPNPTFAVDMATQAELNAVESASSAALALKADLVGGLVPSSQLPSFVDDVLEYADFATLPASGTSGKIYVTLDTNVTYRWSGSAYVEISASLALGTSSATAFRGDYGQIAYLHSQDVTTNPHNVTKTQVGLSAVDNTSDADKPVSTAQATAINLRQLAAEKDQANGYAGLNASGRVVAARLGSGTATSSSVLLGDSSWAQIADAQIGSSAAIALTKLAPIANQRLLGNVSGGAATPSELTAAQGKTLLGLNLLQTDDTAGNFGISPVAVRPASRVDAMDGFFGGLGIGTMYFGNIRENWLLRGNTFNNVTWVKTNVVAVDINQTDPLGQALNASRLTGSASGATLVQTSTSDVTTGNHVASVVLKLITAGASGGVVKIKLTTSADAVGTEATYTLPVGRWVRISTVLNAVAVHTNKVVTITLNDNVVDAWGAQGNSGDQPFSVSLTTSGPSSKQWRLATPLAVLELLSGPNAQTLTASSTGFSLTGALVVTSSVQADGMRSTGTFRRAVTAVAGTTATAAAGTQYQTNNAALTTITLPAAMAAGDEFAVNGQGAGGWKVAQLAGQVIHDAVLGDTTVGTGGSIASTNRYDAAIFRCVVANTEYAIVAARGTLTKT